MLIRKGIVISLNTGKCRVSYPELSYESDWIQMLYGISPNIGDSVLILAEPDGDAFVIGVIP